MPALLIFLVTLVVGLSIGLVIAQFRIKDARGHIEFLSEAQAEAQDLRIEAERRAQAAETELQFLRATLQGLVARPAVAVLTDEHIQTFANIVQSILHPEGKMN